MWGTPLSTSAGGECFFCVFFAIHMNALRNRSQFIAPLVNLTKAYPQLTQYSSTVWGTGDVRTAVSDLRDIGPIVARILSDKRTLNQYVFFGGEEVSQNDAVALAEKVLGKKLELEHVSGEELERSLQSAEGMLAYFLPYQYSLWIRGDNTIGNAKRPEYGGAMDARELYPDFKPRVLELLMREYVADLQEDNE